MATGIMNASSKYKDIISKSVLIQSGSPDVYQLRPKEENFGTLRKLTLGERNVNQINKTILLVGETGAGKSALVNTLVNYTMGVKWEDNIWFKIIEEEEGSQTESQTSDVIVYQIFGYEGETLPYSLTVIDTPGYGDTRGDEYDDDISNRLFELFRSEKGVHEINAVGLVLKATENRLSDRLRYIFDSVMSLFGKNMQESIVALITHSNGSTPRNALKALLDAQIKYATKEQDKPVYFLFDNCQNEDRTEETEQLKHSYETTERGIRQFTDFLSNAAPQTLKTTVEVLNERVRLKACIENLQERIEFIELKQNEIRQTEEALNKHEQEMKNNENFTAEVDEVYKDKVDISETRWWALWLNYGGAVCCDVCEENCHHPCTLAWYAENCEVIKDGFCTSCSRKCSASEHKKEKKKYVTKTRKVLKTLENMKEKYEKNKEECESKSCFLENLKKEIENLTAKKDQWLEESYQHVVKLDEISLNADSLSTHVHLDFLIEKMTMRGDAEKVEKLEKMKLRVEKDKRFFAALRYGHSKLKGFFK